VGKNGNFRCDFLVCLEGVRVPGGIASLGTSDWSVGRCLYLRELYFSYGCGGSTKKRDLGPILAHRVFNGGSCGQKSDAPQVYFNRPTSSSDF